MVFQRFQLQELLDTIAHLRHLPRQIVHRASVARYAIDADLVLQELIEEALAKPFTVKRQNSRMRRKSPLSIQSVPSGL